MAETNRTTMLRRLLAGPGILVAAGVFDGISARVVAQAGFSACYLSGGGVARNAVRRRARCGCGSHIDAVLPGGVSALGGRSAGLTRQPGHAGSQALLSHLPIV